MLHHGARALLCLRKSCFFIVLLLNAYGFFLAYRITRAVPSTDHSTRNTAVTMVVAEQRDVDFDHPTNATSQSLSPTESVQHNVNESTTVTNRVDVRRKPSQPLCPLCLRVVQTAPPVSLKFVRVAGNHSQHLHRGAVHRNGQLGYVLDETLLRRRRPSLQLTQSRQQQLCRRRDDTYTMLTQKVVVDTNQSTASSFPPPKIFCAVYTTRQRHAALITIRRTWGPHCDGFLAASTVTMPLLSAVHIPHEGEESYYNMWQKVRSIWSYIYDHYYETYDWFHMGGDDLFVLVENLRRYLASEEIRTAANGGIYLPSDSNNATTQVPLYLGCRLKQNRRPSEIYNSGGAGYTLNKAALKTLVVDGLPYYYVHNETSKEDVMISLVFRQLGIFPYETKDETGAERYNALTPALHYQYQPLHHKAKFRHWLQWFLIDGKSGLDHCAKYSISFHYIKGNMMYRLYLLLYNQCPAETLIGNATTAASNTTVVMNITETS